MYHLTFSECADRARQLLFFFFFFAFSHQVFCKVVLTDFFFLFFSYFPREKHQHWRGDVLPGAAELPVCLLEHRCSQSGGWSHLRFWAPVFHFQSLVLSCLLRGGKFSDFFLSCCCCCCCWLSPPPAPHMSDLGLRYLCQRSWPGPCFSDAHI